MTGLCLIISDIRCEGEVFVYKRACGASITSTSVILPPISLEYRPGVLQITLESVWRDYDEYKGVGSNLNDTSWKPELME